MLQRLIFSQIGTATGRTCHDLRKTIGKKEKRSEPGDKSLKAASQEGLLLDKNIRTFNSSSSIFQTRVAQDIEHPCTLCHKMHPMPKFSYKSGKTKKPIAAKCSNGVMSFQESRLLASTAMTVPCLKLTGQSEPPELPLLLGWWSQSNM